ncbi:unnamed protein product [Gongylonema pulchrum]|uniref:Uncharacterized protein n=1 Tax=Gongylonema pulchrum TaxID=637853 RepID=A0A183EWZ0_9BILA|nr:unnamed protein product [Gongylonema pulchrum]
MPGEVSETSHKQPGSISLGLRLPHPKLGSWHYRKAADDVPGLVRACLLLSCAVGPPKRVGELSYHQLAGLGAAGDDGHPEHTAYCCLKLL